MPLSPSLPRQALFVSMLLYGAALLTKVFPGVLGAMALAYGWLEALYARREVGVLVAFAWFANPLLGSYAASKSAAWSLTNAARIELRRQGTLVTGVFATFIDTDMAALLDVPKISPRSVVDQTLDGIEAGAQEVLTDDRSRSIKAALPDDLAAIYPAQQARWDAVHPV